MSPFATSSRLAAAAAAVLLAATATAEPVAIPAALGEDDECAAGDAECALNAIQLRGRAEIGTEPAGEFKCKEYMQMCFMNAECCSGNCVNDIGCILPAPGSSRLEQRSMSSVHSAAADAVGRMLDDHRALSALHADNPNATCAAAEKTLQGCSPKFQGTPSPEVVESICSCTPKFQALAEDTVVATNCYGFKAVAELDLSVTESLCDPCMLAAYKLVSANDCTVKDSTGAANGIDKKAACSSSCKPLLCNLLSHCEPNHVFGGMFGSMFPSNFSAVMVANVTWATSDCAC